MQQYRDKGLVRTWRGRTLSVGWGVYPDEYYERELELLCDNMDPEQAAEYLSALGIHNRALLKRLDTIRAFQYLKSLDIGNPPKGIVPDAREYAERVISESPGTLNDIEARFYIAEIIPWRKEFYTEKSKAYQAVLDIDPKAINALGQLGTVLFQDDKPTEAIQYFKQVNNLNPGAGHVGLGWAYEKLGDVKTAWVYYKKALANGYLDPHLLKQHIRQIEAGDPIFKPVPQAPLHLTDAHGHENPTEPHMSQKHIHSPKVLPDVPPWTDPESTPPQDIQDRNAERRRAAAEAVQQAHDNFLRHQELSQKELDDFLQWAETIMNAASLMDTNNFLMKEMEAHLKGGQTQFDPERIVRAFETMKRYGAAEGIKQLQKADPDLAKQMQR